MLLGVGDRVRFWGFVPIGNVELDLRGETGVVKEIARKKGGRSGPKDWNPYRYIEFIRVRVDRHMPILDEWENDIYFDRDGTLADIVDLLTVVEKTKR